MEWTTDDVLRMVRRYQSSCVLIAAADLDVFSALAEGPRTAAQLADELSCDLRGMTVLLDALVARKLCTKEGDKYSPAAGVTALLSEDSPDTLISIVRHQGNCLRRWDQLGDVVKSGRVAERRYSVRGLDPDRASFILAMDDLAKHSAPGLVAELRPRFSPRRLLDVGGASGTWTAAWLAACPNAEAVIFDLPHAIELAEERMQQMGLTDRVTCVAGDFTVDPLPGGCDLAWLSAIMHMNSPEENRQLYSAIHQALEPGGVLLIRDVVMEHCRTQPSGGAMFAVNMLVGTEGGGTFTYDEMRADLEATGYTGIELARQDPYMNSIVAATKA